MKVKLALTFICLVGAMVLFLVKVPTTFGLSDKSLHSLFYFFVAFFLNLLWRNKFSVKRHLVILIGLALFGVGIEYLQGSVKNIFGYAINRSFEVADIWANLRGLIAFSLVWLMGYVLYNLFKK